MEHIIKATLRQTPGAREQALMLALENIKIVALAYGSRTKIDEPDRHRSRVAALDTINNLATKAIIGDQSDGTEPYQHDDTSTDGHTD